MWGGVVVLLLGAAGIVDLNKQQRAANDPVILIKLETVSTQLGKLEAIATRAFEEASDVRLGLARLEVRVETLEKRQ